MNSRISGLSTLRMGTNAREVAANEKTAEPQVSSRKSPAQVDGSKAQTVRQAWDVRGAGSLELPPSRPPDLLQNVAFEISQSGAVFPIGYGSPNPRALVPGFPGFFEKMVVTPLNPGKWDPRAEYPLNDQGVLKPRTGQRPLGHQPYRVTLVAKDGSKWSGEVDVSPKKVGWTGDGYIATRVELRREIPPAPPAPRPPAELKNVRFEINQSGKVFPQGYGTRHPTPLVPGFEGFFEKMEVVAQDPMGLHNKAELSINARGVVCPDCYQKNLGTHPYLITLVAKDGQRWSANVDVTPAKVGWAGAGYQPVDVTFTQA